MKLPPMPSPFGALKPINRPLERVAEEPEPEKSEPTTERPPTLQEAISYIYAKSVQQLSKETGLPKGKVKKELDRLWNSDYLEERNGHYRYQNTAAWKVSSQ